MIWRWVDVISSASGSMYDTDIMFKWRPLNLICGCVARVQGLITTPAGRPTLFAFFLALCGGSAALAGALAFHFVDFAAYGRADLVETRCGFQCGCKIITWHHWLFHPAGPNIRAVLMNVNPSERRGTVFSAFTLCDDLGKGLGPSIASGLHKGGRLHLLYISILCTHMHTLCSVS